MPGLEVREPLDGPFEIAGFVGGEGRVDRFLFTVLQAGGFHERRRRGGPAGSDGGGDGGGRGPRRGNVADRLRKEGSTGGSQREKDERSQGKRPEGKTCPRAGILRRCGARREHRGRRQG